MEKKKSPGRGRLYTAQMKAELSKALEQLLWEGAYPITADFEWSERGHLFSFLFREEKIRMVINLNTIYRRRNWLPEKTLLSFMSTFMAAWIRQTEKAPERIPRSYYEGLIWLNGINDLLGGKKIYVYLPFERAGRSWKNEPIRPAEVQAAVGALNQIRILGPQECSKAQEAELERLLRELFLYSSLPEIERTGKGRGWHSPLFGQVEILRQNLKAHPGEAGQVIFLKECLEMLQASKTREALAEKTMSSGNAFLRGAALRLLAWTDPEQRLVPGIILEWREEMEAYGAACADYAKAVDKAQLRFVKENFRAAAELAGRMKRMEERTEIRPETGRVHTIQ